MCSLGIKDYRIKSRIKAVLFDLYGTLVKPMPKSELAAVLLTRGLDPNSAAFPWLVAGLAQAQLAERMGADIATVRDIHLTRPLATIEEMVACIPHASGIVLPADILSETQALFELMLDGCTLEEGTLELLDAIKSEGIQLGLVSNVNSFSARVITRLGLNQWFPEPILSCNVGICKPDPAIFRMALLNLKVEPVNALMVGDSWSSDIIGALRSEMSAFWLIKNRHKFTLSSVKNQLSQLSNKADSDNSSIRSLTIDQLEVTEGSEKTFNVQLNQQSLRKVTIVRSLRYLYLHLGIQSR